MAASSPCSDRACLAGAAGLVQIMHPTAKSLGLKVTSDTKRCRTSNKNGCEYTTDERFNPNKNLKASTKFLKRLLKKYEKKYEGDLYRDLIEEWKWFKPIQEQRFKEYEDMAARYVSHLIKSNPNADAHLGFSTVAPAKGPGGPEVTKRFLEKVGSPENLYILTGEEKKNLWVEAGKEVLRPGVRGGVYYKDKEGIWRWTDGKKTTTVPKDLLKYL